MTIKTAVVVLTALTSAAAVGCSGGGSGSAGTGSSTDATKASLHRAKDCPDLLTDLKADAKWKLDRAIDYDIAGIKLCQAHYPDAQCAQYGGINGGGGLAVPQSSFGVDEAAGAPTSGMSSSGASGNASSSSGGTGASPSAPAASDSGGKSASATNYSQTNTEVAGVDEADIVKNDGSNIYVLHGRAFKIVHAFPATEMKESGSIDIEGTPNEMFVANGKVVVYSSVNGAAVFTAAGVASRSQYQDFGYGGVVYASSGGTADVAPTAPGYPGQPVETGPYIPLTKMTVLTMNGDTPVVTRESWFEGNYLDSRRVGASVRTVYQGNAYGPTLKYSVYEVLTPQDPNSGGPLKGTGTVTPADVSPYPQSGTAMISALEKLRSVNEGIIDASVIGDWLPYTFVRQNNATTASTTACSDFYIPTIGSTESGVTEVSTFDLGDATATPRETAILGQADTVYANDSSLYVAARAWIQPPQVWSDPYAANSGGGVSGSGTTVASPPPPATDAGTSTSGNVGTKSLHPLTAPTWQGTAPPLSWSDGNTHIHKFEFASDPMFGNYVASGTVAGTVKDQFSLDEYTGNLRIATTEQRNYYTPDNVYVQPDFTTTTTSNGGTAPVNPRSVSHVFVLGQQGALLNQIGSVGDIAPNEQLYSVRFVNGRGYVVTARQMDPLFVVDLQNPTAPAVLGELTIPGFSEYMHPLDDGHLLTIGRDGSGQLQLQIFDVTNGAAPKQTAQLAYTGGANGSSYASSDAEYDHKAFTFFADKGLLAIPFYAYSYGTNGQSMHSALEVFHVDIGSGIQFLGEVDASNLVSGYNNGYCGGYYGPSVRRGVFLDNEVYAITYGGISAKDVTNLSAPALTFPLEYPVANDSYGAAMVACAAPVATGGGDDPAPIPQK